MRRSLQNHSTQLWNWVANDLGGEVMVLIRGSKRLEQDSAVAVEMNDVFLAKKNDNDHGYDRKSIKLDSAGSVTDLSDKGLVQPVIIHEGFL
jgi:hypothetical protein